MSGIGVLGILALPGDLVNRVFSNDLQHWFKRFVQTDQIKPFHSIPDVLSEQAQALASCQMYAHHQTADPRWYQYGEGAYAFPCWQNWHPSEGLLQLHLPVFHTKDGGQTWKLLTTLSHFHLEAFAKVDWPGSVVAADLLPVYTYHAFPSQLTPGFEYATVDGFLQLTPNIHKDGMDIKVALLNQQAEAYFVSSIRSEHLKSSRQSFIYA